MLALPLVTAHTPNSVAVEFCLAALATDNAATKQTHPSKALGMAELHLAYMNKQPTRFCSPIRSSREQVVLASCWNRESCADNPNLRSNVAEPAAASQTDRAAREKAFQTSPRFQTSLVWDEDSYAVCGHRRIRYWRLGRVQPCEPIRFPLQCSGPARVQTADY
jgi:hypothetical protein